MKATELRIGNFVDRENSGHLLEITKEHLYYWDKFKCVLFPMRLTEEWLLKFGFEKHKNGYTWFLEKDCNGDLRTSEDHDEDMLDSFSIDMEDVNVFYFNGISKMPDIQIRFVHQLQNLYFALTEEELIEKI